MSQVRKDYIVRTTEFIDEDQYLGESLYSEPEQKEYASIRKMAKQTANMARVGKKYLKNDLDERAMYQGLRKIGGRINRMANPNSLKNTNAINKFTKKAANQIYSVNPTSKTNPSKVQSLFKDSFIQGTKKGNGIREVLRHF
jgi:hypothetical protein